MPQPIPPYLIALAAGRLESRGLGPRSRVHAEPETVEAAAHEFAETEAMIARAEELFGPYDWDRYDMLVLPPSFPYGGMENPRMTFLTPTLLAGDRSLVDVVAHELAHSWTGNLVTNATAEHFWLNEGFTVWAERRILDRERAEAMATACRMSFTSPPAEGEAHIADVLNWVADFESDYSRFLPGSVVSRTLIRKTAGTVTVFAFDAGQGLSEHTAPFDALVQVLDGEVEIRISGRAFNVKPGEIIVMPASEPHALKAVSRFKMLLTIIRS